MGFRKEKRCPSSTSPWAHLRTAYQHCFNRWYSEKFLKGQWDKEECVTEWQKYRACLSVRQLLLDKTCMEDRIGYCHKLCLRQALLSIASAIGQRTKLVWLESPTNPRQQICDIRKIAELAHAHGALVLVDNSIMSPVLCRPLELGADLVMNSATKFVSGHSDVMAGALAVKGESLAKDLYFLQNAEGSGLAPFHCWICLRGIKTMALRVEKQQENAQKIAEFLASHPRVKKVNYAGLPDHPGCSLHYSQSLRCGASFSKCVAGQRRRIGA